MSARNAVGSSRWMPPSSRTAATRRPGTASDRPASGIVKLFGNACRAVDVSGLGGER